MSSTLPVYFKGPSQWVLCEWFTHEGTCEVAIPGVRQKRNTASRPVGPRDGVKFESDPWYGDLTCPQVCELNYTTVVCMVNRFFVGDMQKKHARLSVLIDKAGRSVWHHHVVTMQPRGSARGYHATRSCPWSMCSRIITHDSLIFWNWEEIKDFTYIRKVCER